MFNYTFLVLRWSGTNLNVSGFLRTVHYKQLKTRKGLCYIHYKPFYMQQNKKDLKKMFWIDQKLKQYFLYVPTIIEHRILW